MRPPDRDRREGAAAAALLGRLADEHDPDRGRIVRRLGFDPLTGSATPETAILDPALVDAALPDAALPGSGTSPRTPQIVAERDGPGQRRTGSRRAGRGRPGFGRAPGKRGRLSTASPVGVAAATVAVIAAVSVVVATAGSQHSVGAPGSRLARDGSSTTAMVPPTTTSPLTPSAPATPTAAPTATGGPGPSTTQPSATAVGLGPAAAPGQAGAVSGAPGAARVLGHATAPVPATAPGPATATGSVASAPTVATGAPTPAAAGVRPVASGTVVTLAGGADWAAVVRRDGTVVEPKLPVIGALGVRWTGAQPGQAAPYSVSWSGGVPEQDHSAATTWLAIGPGGSATITVPALPRAATLTLYLGSQGADVAVSGAGRASWAHLGTGPAAVVVTVHLPASAAAATVTVAPAAAQPGGVVGLAAASLS